MNKYVPLLIAVGLALLAVWFVSLGGSANEPGERVPRPAAEPPEASGLDPDRARDPDGESPRTAIPPKAAESRRTGEEQGIPIESDPPNGILAISVLLEDDSVDTAFAADVVDRESEEQVAFVRRDWGDAGPVSVSLSPGTYVVTLRESPASPPPLYLGARELARTVHLGAGSDRELRFRANLGGRFVLETRNVPADRPLEIQARRKGGEWRDLRLIRRESADQLDFLLVATRGHRYTTSTLEPGHWSLRVTDRSSGAEVARAESDLLPGEIRHVTL